MRATFVGRRTHHTTGVHKDVLVAVEISVLNDTFKVVDGGVTGHESYKLSDLLDDRARLENRGLVLCTGTPGRWDYLWISGRELEETFSVMHKLGDI